MTSTTTLIQLIDTAGVLSVPIQYVSEKKREWFDTATDLALYCTFESGGIDIISWPRIGRDWDYCARLALTQARKSGLIPDHIVHVILPDGNKFAIDNAD